MKPLARLMNNPVNNTYANKEKKIKTLGNVQEAPGNQDLL